MAIPEEQRSPSSGVSLERRLPVLGGHSPLVKNACLGPSEVSSRFGELPASQGWIASHKIWWSKQGLGLTSNVQSLSSNLRRDTKSSFHDA